MAPVRLGSAERDRLGVRSIVEGVPAAAEIGEECAESDDPSGNQILVDHSDGVIGYATVRWWQERDGTRLYLHRGHLLPAYRGRGIGSAMLDLGRRPDRPARTAARDRAVGGVRRERHGVGRTGLSAGFRRRYEYVRHRKPVHI